MRYDRNHKARTHAAIVDAASSAFREDGIEQVGVDEIMARAGLTRGGFYAHFGGKEDLVAEACAAGLVDAAQKFDPAGENRPSLRQYIRSYLSRSHRDAPATGCTVAALGGELARRTPETRAAFTRAAETYVEGVTTLLPEGVSPDAAWALLAGMAGTVMLARAVDDPALSDRILRAGRALYTEALAGEDPT